MVCHYHSHNRVEQSRTYDSKEMYVVIYEMDIYITRIFRITQAMMTTEKNFK